MVFMHLRNVSTHFSLRSLKKGFNTFAKSFEPCQSELCEKRVLMHLGEASTHFSQRSVKKGLNAIEISLTHFSRRSVKKGLNAFAKSFGPCQPARTSLADMGLNFSPSLNSMNAKGPFYSHPASASCLTKWTLWINN